MRPSTPYFSKNLFSLHDSNLKKKKHVKIVFFGLECFGFEKKDRIARDHIDQDHD